MKIINKTRYDSKVLRAVFAECMRRVKQDYQPDWHKVRKLRVTVVYGRLPNFVGGSAHRLHPSMRIKIPYRWKPGSIDRGGIVYQSHQLIQAVASTFIHELGHHLGILNHVRGPNSWACYTIEHHYEQFIYDNFNDAKCMIDPDQPKLEKKANSLIHDDHAPTDNTTSTD